MNILFIGKRFNTNRDALLEKFGRNYQFPLHLAAHHTVALWLVDYHTKATINGTDGPLSILSTPVKNLAVLKHYLQRRHQTSEPTDIIIASGDCYIGLMAYRLAKKLQAKFVFDVYDKYDEFGGYVRPFGFDLFGYLLKNADMRLFASHALLQNLGKPRLDAILSNGIDANHFRPIDKAQARHKLELPADTCYVGYFGSMESDRGVQDLITAVHLLRQQGQEIELLLGGKIEPSLDLNQPGIRYLGNVPFADVPYALAACDVLAVPYRRSPFMDAGASNKIAEAMACLRPIVATQTPNFAANFPQQAQSLAPYLAEPSNPPSLATALRKQLHDRHLVPQPNNIYWPDITAGIEQHLIAQLYAKS
ncbi:Predicted glycosyl transferase, group 1 [gamma proteobacterium HdN1]|nr:Predicted glycosyl transferase, group 1 [gamma proteobacterium HdN1]